MTAFDTDRERNRPERGAAERRPCGLQRATGAQGRTGKMRDGECRYPPLRTRSPRGKRAGAGGTQGPAVPTRPGFGRGAPFLTGCARHMRRAGGDRPDCTGGLLQPEQTWDYENCRDRQLASAAKRKSPRANSFEKWVGKQGQPNYSEITDSHQASKPFPHNHSSWQHDWLSGGCCHL